MSTTDKAGTVSQAESDGWNPEDLQPDEVVRLSIRAGALVRADGKPAITGEYVADVKDMRSEDIFAVALSIHKEAHGLARGLVELANARRAEEQVKELIALGAATDDKPKSH